MKKKKTESLWVAERICPSEPKLGNVTTGLQGDSLTLVGNLAVPICTRNVAFIYSLILFCKMRYDKTERPCLSYTVFFKSIIKSFRIKMTF